jgi:hypothetical protein
MRGSGARPGAPWQLTQEAARDAPRAASPFDWAQTVPAAANPQHKKTARRTMRIRRAAANLDIYFLAAGLPAL